MQSVTFKVVLTLACLLATVTVAAAQSSAASIVQQVAALAYPDSPLTVVPRRSETNQPPRVVRFTVTNDADARILNYDVRVFAYRANGRPLGFSATRQHATLSHGAQHSALVSLPDSMPLEPGVCLLVTVTAATFEDGGRWHAPEDEIERAKAEMLRVAETGALAR